MNFSHIDKSNFEEAIKFLAIGFEWKDFRIQQVKDFLLNSNLNEGFFGFVIKDKNKRICGAILTPFQICIKNTKVISLMAWFIIPEIRGITSLNFAIYFVNQLKNKGYIITDYTPSEAVIKILKYLNFSKMNVLTKRNFLFLRPIGLIKEYLFKSNSKIVLINWDNNIEYFKNFNQGNMKLYKFTCNDKETLFIGKNLNIKKKLFNYEFSIPIFRVFWTENENILLSNLDSFCLSIFKELHLLILYVDIRNKKYQGIDKGNYFLFSPNYYIYDIKHKLDFIPALGSEFTLNFP